MVRTKKLWLAIGAAAVGAAVIYAHSAGPDPRHTGAPGDDPLACTTAGCHVGTPLNGGGGNVAVNFQNGQTYTPGVQQTFTIVVTDSVAKVYGFQMTARLESNLANGQAGDFTAGAQQIVICDNASFKTSKGCPASAPVEFIEHNQPFKTNTITVLWTAPATNVGNVHIYVAANAANGNGNETGDHIYTANYVLTPKSACTDATPKIDSVVSASGFSASAGLASGTWLEIYGSNLSCSTRPWAGSDFKGLNGPTSLDGVSVAVGGIPAFVAYISMGQINVQAPDDAKTGAGFQVVVTNAAGQSNAFAMQRTAIAPALLSPPAFNVQGHQWVVAQFSDQTFVGKPGMISGVNFRPAKFGDTIVIYGIGFGPVNPATAAGTIAAGTTSLQNQPTFRFGQVPAKLGYAGLAPSFVGLYQFNVIVPQVSPGDMELSVEVGGVTMNQNLFTTVQ